MSHWYACFAMPDPNMEASKPREYPSLVDMGKALLIPGGVSSVVVLLLGFGGLWLELEVTYPQQTSYETLYATSLLPTKVVIG
jgi:hypothetical protein